MEQLSAVIAAQPELLLDMFRAPAVTAWNRLEPRPRSHDFTRSLRAEIRDPLWMLTRQWQLGELRAEDAGSPIDARLVTRRSQIDRVRIGSGAAVALDDSHMPLEAAAERERVPFTHALRVQAAQYFLRLHPPALRAKYLPRYRAAFPFPANLEDQFRGDIVGLNLYRATRRLGFDGEAALVALADGSFASAVPVDTADAAALQPAIDGFTSWLDRQYLQPAPGASSGWSSSELSYSLAIAAPTESGQTILSARRYREGHLDWYSFDLEQGSSTIVVDDDDHVEPTPERETISFIPVPATFKGAPNPRFWEIEERKINFGALNAQTTDHLLLVFAEMGLIYGNDWFVVPYRLAVNSLCEVLGLVVTDVFGDRTIIRPADEGAEDWRRWSLFDIRPAENSGALDRQLYLPAAVGTMLESEPLERVQFVRDEMANMVWAVEEIIPGAAGNGINGHDAADKNGVTPEPIEDSPAAIRYVLGTTVPENWIPFIPVQRPGSVQAITIQRAAMPKLGSPPREVVNAKGILLNEPALPWFVNEEEIPYAGTIVTRSYQRARWYDGRTCLWVGRRAETGRGIGSSGLRFDQIEPIAS
jgi:hypothetical protein